MNDIDKSKEKRIKELEKLQNRYEARIENLEKELNQCKNSEKILYEMINTNPNSVQIIDKKGYSISVNDAHTRLFSALPPTKYNVFNDDKLLNQGLGICFEKLKQGEFVFFPDTYYNAHDVNPKFPDKPVWIKTLGFPRYDHHGKPERFILVHEDITEKKQAEEKIKQYNEQLHALTKHIQDLIEEERKLIARDLHDDLGQLLYATKLNIESLGIKHKDKQLSNELKNISEQINLQMQAVKQLTSKLRPRLIGRPNMKSDIENFIKNYANQFKIKIISKIDYSIKLPANVSLQIFRILQEALTNISKHAQANKIEITLKRNSDSVAFIIADNGKGVTEKEIKSRTSYGLMIMQERASSINGTFSINRKKTQGTQIKIKIPNKN